jgi:hypothetical protein
MERKMEPSVEPERELVRRAAPFFVPACGLALVIGAVAGGWSVAWSATLGVAIVAANFALSGLSLSWAARISLTAIAAVVMGGFIVRMAAIVAIMYVLDRFTEWFVPLAFGLAVVPATLILLGFELRLLSRNVGGDLIIPADRRVAP